MAGRRQKRRLGTRPMRHSNVIGITLACALALLVADAARAGEWPDDCEESTLPSDDPNYPNEQLILTCLPSDFNGTLVIYAHGYVRPQEPLALPEEFGDADVQELVQRLVDLGFGVATSSYHKNGYAVEQAEADLNRLVDDVKAREPDVDAVYIAGASGACSGESQASLGRTVRTLQMNVSNDAM
jgi:hypothetical protein